MKQPGNREREATGKEIITANEIVAEARRLGLIP